MRRVVYEVIVVVDDDEDEIDFEDDVYVALRESGIDAQSAVLSSQQEK